MIAFGFRRAPALLACLLTVVLPLSATAAGDSDPQIILDEIYGQVSEMCSGDGGPPYDFVAIAKTYFTPTLAKKIEKAANDNALDFDVLVDGQDCKVTELDLRIVGGGETSAIGRAEFKNMGEARTIDLLMSKAAGTWQVTDIVYRHRTFSLKSSSRKSIGV